MASSQKKFYYVGILSHEVSNNEIKFVHKIDNESKIAHWGTYKELREKKTKPLAMTKTNAEYYAKCLCFNFYLAVVVESFIELQ